VPLCAPRFVRDPGQPVSDRTLRPGRHRLLTWPGKNRALEGSGVSLQVARARRAADDLVLLTRPWMMKSRTRLSFSGVAFGCLVGSFEGKISGSIFLSGAQH